MKIIDIDGRIINDNSENEEDLPFSKTTFGREPIDRNPHKITQLKSAVRDENRVNVFLGSNFAFSLDISQVVDYHLKVGMILSDKEIKELEHASEFGKLYNRTLEWALTRPHSIKETREYLEKRLVRIKYDNGHRRTNAERIKNDPEFAAKREEYKIQTKERKLYTREDIEEVISRLVAKKYLDDVKFVNWYIENRFVKKGVSRNRLYRDLSQKGIDKTLIDTALLDSDRDETSEAKKVIKKFGPKLSQDKLLRRLISRGFPYDLSKTLVSSYFSDPDNFFEE